MGVPSSCRQQRAKMRAVLLVTLVLCVQWCHGFKAGAAKVDGTLPVGVPIAGYNHGDRRVPHWPIPEWGEYTAFMTPSEGVMNPTWVKALVIDDENGERICFVTTDTMCADSSLAFLAHALAVGQGFTVPFSKVTFSGSHTHSGPGAWVPELGIQVTPTMDLFVPKVQRLLAKSIAEAMVQAEQNLEDAVVGIGVGQVTNVTHNRRANISPYVNSDTIDPNLGILRVDSASGEPIATLWNFAVHGVCFGPDNMFFSSDIMGGASDNIEKQGGGIALFINGDAGDISPNSDACEGKPDYAGGHTLANTAMDVRDSISPSSSGTIDAVSVTVDFGFTQTNWTLARNENCTEGGPFNICTICNLLGCDLNLEAPSSMVEEDPRFTAFRFNIDGKNTAFVSIPGEGLVELGWQIRNDTLDLGFDTTFLVGYTNNYLMYFATPNEYLIGGYEASLTLWGINTAEKVRASIFAAAKQVQPSGNTRHERFAKRAAQIVEDSIIEIARD